MIRVYAGLALVALLALGGWYLHHAGYASGAASVQAQWDADKAAQTLVVAQAQAKAVTTEHSQAAQISAITTTYLQQAISHAPSIADSIPAALSAGTLQLRDVSSAATCPGRVSTATAASRAIDAAATQALADRVSHSIAAVRAADAADARERQLDAQVTGLQAVLDAERSP